MLKQPIATDSSAWSAPLDEKKADVVEHPKVFDQWKVSTPATYQSTITTIENSGTDPLNATTVADSGSPDLADTLNGSSKATTDWFFAHTSGGSNPNDTINNAESGDIVTSI